MKYITATIVALSMLWHVQTYAIEEDNLYIFVGEIISYEITKTEGEFPEEFPEDRRKSIIHMDTEFTVKYKILKTFNGSLPRDEVQFKSYGRYKIPPFSKYDHVLIFLTKINGELVLIRYQYFDVYRTSDGNWATCGARDGYLLDDLKEWPDWYLKNPSDAKIASDQNISYGIEDVNYEIKSCPDQYTMEDFYPRKYFDISEDEAVCKGIGITASELVRDHKRLLVEHWSVTGDVVK